MIFMDALLLIFISISIIFSVLWLRASRKLKSYDLELGNHKTIEKDLSISKRELKGILDNLQDTYYRTDAEGTLLFVSSSVEPLLDYKPEE
ncbi:MAG: PAS domain-containing protein, partial [Gammaproteobacteria bacterium]|nr:PAS domain-containing protein [Gammaproteobacteria bacterium]